MIVQSSCIPFEEAGDLLCHPWNFKLFMNAGVIMVGIGVGDNVQAFLLDLINFKV